METVTEQDLLAALEMALQQATEADGSGYMTTRELKEQLMWGEGRIRDGLRRLKLLGRLDMRMVYRQNLLDTMVQVPGYRLRATDE